MVDATTTREGTTLENRETMTAAEAREAGVIPTDHGTPDLRHNMETAYYNHVLQLAEAAAKTAEQHDVPLSEAVHETVDGDGLVIYYKNNLAVVTNSSLDPDELELKPYTEGADTHREYLQGVAYCVLRADVRRELVNAAM